VGKKSPQFGWDSSVGGVIKTQYLQKDIIMPGFGMTIATIKMPLIFERRKNDHGDSKKVRTV
jgi:hypothetical protein